MAKGIRKKEQYADRFHIRMQGGKGGLVEATSKMEINEFRVFATALTMILPNDEDFTEYEIRVPDIIKLFDLRRNGNYYEAFKDAALSLMDRKFVIYETQENGKEYKNTIPLSIKTREAVDPADRTQIRLQFHPMLKPYLLDLKREYLTVDVRNLTNIQSHYTIKLYFILKHQQRLGNVKSSYEVSALRRILGLEDDEYILYGNFKQAILKKGIEDINKHTDLQITKIEEHKNVRAVESITFHINSKTPQRELEISTPLKARTVKSSSGEVITLNQKASVALQEYELVTDKPTTAKEIIDYIFAKVKKHKISRTTVTKWVNELPFEQIEIGVEYVLNKIKSGESIKNVGGYLNNMVNSPSLFDVKQQELQEKKLKKQEKQQADAERQQELDAQKRKDDLLNSYTRAKIEAIKSIIKSHQLENIIIESLHEQAQAEKPSFLVSMAFGRYSTFLDKYQGYTPLIDAIDHAGFMFSSYVSEWVANHMPEQLQAVKEQYQAQAKLLGVDLI